MNTPASLENFLSALQWRPSTAKGVADSSVRLFIGKGYLGVEVLVIEAPSALPESSVRKIWKERNAGRPAPLLVVVLHGSTSASICGISLEHSKFFDDLDRSQVERICLSMLECEDRNKALGQFARAADSLEGLTPGIRNEGLLSGHQLATRVRERKDWDSSKELARSAVGTRDSALLRALGYEARKMDNHTSVLYGADHRLALAVLLEEHETPESGSLRFAGLSPVSYAMAKADTEGLRYVITVSGGNIRLYCTSPNAGVSRRGRTETFVEADTGIICEDHSALLWLLFSPSALKPGGTLEEILSDSERYAGALAKNLRARIYEEVVPALVKAVVGAERLRRPTAEKLRQTYETALTILFRLLFIAYAEDKDLLPYRYNDAYRKRSLKTKARELLDAERKGVPFAAESSLLWGEIRALFTAIDKGNPNWGIPRYNGGLFSSDPEVSEEGAAIASLDLPDAEFGPVLAKLLLIEQDSGLLGPVDFASLGVREFGTVYEGLLELELSVASCDLSEDKDGSYAPHSGKTEPNVKEGEVYLHGTSGARKSTGSFFTKDFAVQYLVDKALGASLSRHFERLDSLDDSTAARDFFDFKAADISMGSGHFLIAAIDKMEIMMSGYLARRPLKGVSTELETLRQAAAHALGEISSQLEPLEDGKLLRRLIAKRCIYGADINPLAVQLARLAVWIHTFVPGLPLSLLDRNLVCGNSLVGIGSPDEIHRRFADTDTELFRVDARALFASATEPLVRLARLSDATYAEIERARKAIDEAEEAVAPAKALCDIIAAQPLAKLYPDAASGKDSPALLARRKWDSANEPLVNFQFECWEDLRLSVVGSKAHKRALNLLEGTSVLHFPVAFPEVFLRDRPGFDCIVGNPPWEEVATDEKSFWTRYFPGIKGRTQREYETKVLEYRSTRPDLHSVYKTEENALILLRKVLSTSVNPMGAGDPDLYKAFAWRFWDLSREGSGEVGVVLPRTALASKGSELFRKKLFEAGAGIDCCVLLNTGNWVFDEVDGRYTVALTVVSKAPVNSGKIYLRGPFSSRIAFDSQKLEINPVTSEQILEWNEAAIFPLLPNEESLPVFLKLRESPRLDAEVAGEWVFRPNREMDATNDKHLMDLESEKCPRGFWPVYKGESFDIWNPDTGKYYGWADPKIAVEHLHQKRLRTFERETSPFYGISPKEAADKKTLPCHRARIAFRDITNRTNTRTFIACLIPPKCFLTNKAPYWVSPPSTPMTEAYLLGVASSLPFDWFVRRFVELSANFFLISPSPVPRPAASHPLRKRVVELAGRLASPDERFAEWANEVGVECGPLDPAVKLDMIHELDAVVAHLYGLSKKQLKHIFETFHSGWDYAARLKATLVHYDRWAK